MDTLSNNILYNAVRNNEETPTSKQTKRGTENVHNEGGTKAVSGVIRGET